MTVQPDKRSSVAFRWSQTKRNWCNVHRKELTSWTYFFNCCWGGELEIILIIILRHTWIVLKSLLVLHPAMTSKESCSENKTISQAGKGPMPLLLCSATHMKVPSKKQFIINVCNALILDHSLLRRWVQCLMLIRKSETSHIILASRLLHS